MFLSLRTASVVLGKDPNPYRRDERLLVYQRDLLEPFGVEVEESLLHGGSHITFAELAEDLLDAAPSPVGSPDLILVAYGLPDSYPFKTIASHLDHLLGGGSYCFAVSEQGLRAPFTALRIAKAFARSGRCRSLALFVLEQTTFPYDDPFVRGNPLVDSGVMLVFGEDGSYEIAGLYGGQDGEPLGGPLCAASDAVSGTALVVAGPWTDTDAVMALGHPYHQVAPGSYCTSVWLDLARHHQAWTREYATLVLCDTDPRSGRSQAAVLRRRQRPEDGDGASAS
jgi:hypothetical protein